ncbi:MAG: heparinase II/III family protein [Clostridia bacterium]|nr:heparinase II/III family protein [Clostridia bacterium]
MNKREFDLKNAEFSDERFGSGRTVFVSRYPRPPYAPTVGEHPRLLYKASDLPSVRRAFDLPESKYCADVLRKFAEEEVTGILPEPTEKWGQTYNYDGRVLTAIRTKALFYSLTGDPSYGYEAILAIKNFLLTLNIVKMNDRYRPYGHTVMTAAAVYDACHDLLSEKDKDQIVRGCEHFCLSDGKMEIGFPPTAQSPVSSHGSEAQLLRDYLSFAVAIYDEYPDWWELVGGRFYAEYVPFRNIYYASGISPQGVGLYGMYRHNFDMWSAWIIKTAIGVLPYSKDCERIVPSYLCAETPRDTEVFPHGDWYGKDIGLRDYHDADYKTSVVSTYGVSTTMIYSGLFRSSTARAAGKFYSKDFTDFLYENNFFTPLDYMLVTAMWDKTVENRHEGLPTVLYHGAPIGMVTAREAWDDENAAAVFMKIGERTTANHDHEDAGSFQIFYKGWLTRDGGNYSGYGSDQHYYFHQATVGHNSLLIYDPALKDTCRGWYSGGQKKLREAQSVSEWLTDTYRTGKVLAHDEVRTGGEYSRPDYVYLDGEITPAYPKETAEYVRRSMLSVFTGDKKCPLFFAVRDEITATDGGFEKIFLLRTKNEPRIDGKTVTACSDGGKLTLTNLMGGDTLTAIGGEGRHYEIRGRDVPVLPGMSDEMWGRVEISPKTGNKTDVLVNFIAVTDKDETAPAPVSLCGDGFVGGKISDRVILFFRDGVKDVVLPGQSGEHTYYLLGAETGNYTVSGENGEFCVTVGAGRGVLTFRCAGTVRVKKTELA